MLCRSEILWHVAFVSRSEKSCDVWNLVLDRLREVGACCIHGLDEISWTDCIETGIQELAERIGSHNETILVGHSIAGLFLSSIGEALGATSEVYIAALIPQLGKSVFDRLLMSEEIFSESWIV